MNRVKDWTITPHSVLEVQACTLSGWHFGFLFDVTYGDHAGFGIELYLFKLFLSVRYYDTRHEEDLLK